MDVLFQTKKTEHNSDHRERSYEFFKNVSKKRKNVLLGT